MDKLKKLKFKKINKINIDLGWSVFKNKKIKKKRNFLSLWLGFFLQIGLKIKINNFFLNAFNFFFLFLKKNYATKFTHFNYFKKNISLNPNLFDLNNIIYFLFLNFSMIFCFNVEKSKQTNTIQSNKKFNYIWFKKRKLFFLKWMKNKLILLKKQKFIIKLLSLLLDLLLNFKNSSFFKFKTLIYKKFLNFSCY